MKSLLPNYGIGIEFTDDGMIAVCGKQFLGGRRIIDRIHLSAAEIQSSSDCGRVYSDFLQRNKLQAPWTVVVAPRDSYVYRELQLPMTVAEDLGSVIALQLDSYHPFAAGDVVWDAEPLGKTTSPAHSRGREGDPVQKTLTAAVAIARREKSEELADWFSDRHMPVSQIVASPVLFSQLLRKQLLGDGSTYDGAIVIYLRNTFWEIVSRSGDGRVSTRFVEGDSAGELGGRALAERIVREVETASAQLRLEADARLHVLLAGNLADQSEMLVPELAQVDSTNTYTVVREGVLAESAVDVALERVEGHGINLLPIERRQFIPRVEPLPTYALAAVVLILAIGLGVRGSIQDWQFNRRLDDEIATLQPRIQEIESVREQAGAEYSRILRLATIRESGRVPIEVLEELTRLLPEDAWLSSVQMDGSTLTIGGTATSASSVLQSLSSGARFESAQFSSAISRSSDGKESFRIGARLRTSLR